MSGHRLKRSRLSESKSKAPGVASLGPKSWRPIVEKSPFNLEVLRELPNGKALLSCLLSQCVGKRKPRTTCRTVRIYLNFVVAKGLSVGEESLLLYRDELGKDKLKVDGTRQQYFSSAAWFVRCLMAKKVIDPQTLPEGFRDVQRSPIPTLSEAAESWDEVRRDPEFVARMARPSVAGLDKAVLEALVVNELWMDTLGKFAWKAVQAQIADWELGRRLVLLSEKESFAERWEREKGIENALGALHQCFGAVLPPASLWPGAIYRYLQTRKWPSSRVRGVFFPTTKGLRAFLVLALANPRLMPNVDSVLKYAFVGCVSSTGDPQLKRVLFGKFRGGDCDQLLDASAPVVRAFTELERCVKSVIEAEGFPFEVRTEDGGIPLFLHNPPRGEPIEVKGVSVWSAADMVGEFIRDCSRSSPNLIPLVGKVTGRNFRSTHLLCRRLRGESIFLLQKDASHSQASTTIHYLDRVEVAATVMQDHRNFQSYMITEARASKHRRLGNGFHCDAKMAPTRKCLRLDLCGAGPDGCRARRVVLTSPRIVAEWLVCSAHIKNGEEYLRVHRPERWDGIWKPRLIEYGVLLEQVPRSLLRQAMAFVDEVELPPLD